MKKLFLFLILFSSVYFSGCAKKAVAPVNALIEAPAEAPSAIGEAPPLPPPPPPPAAEEAVPPSAAEETRPGKRRPGLLHPGPINALRPVSGGIKTDASSLPFKPPVKRNDSLQTKGNSVPTTVNQVVASLQKANIAFNVHEKLNLKQTAQIELLLSTKESAETLRNAIEAAGAREGATIKVSKRMEASLTGAAFQITEITPKEQIVDSLETVYWKWDVTPTSLGQHPLHLTLTALVSVDGATTRRAIRTFDKTINVNVTATQWAEDFIAKNWQWLWAAILLPLAGGVWKQWKPKNNTPK